jgi:hypothetical protein
MRCAEFKGGAAHGDNEVIIGSGHTSPSRGGRRAERAGWGEFLDAGGLTPPGSDLAVFAALPVKGRDECN